MAADILIIDDEADIRGLIAGILEDEGFETRLAHNSDAAWRKSPAPSLAHHPGHLADGFEARWSRSPQHPEGEAPEVPVIIISGHGNIETAVAAIKRGAYEYIEKPSRQTPAARRRPRAGDLAPEARKRGAQGRAGADAELLGSSAAMRQLRQLLKKIAPSNSRVLITGPMGSGKELAARTLHAMSLRASGPFVTLSAAAMAPERMEEELFARRGRHRRHPAAWGRWRRPMAAPSTSMNWPTCRSKPRARFCACWWTRLPARRWCEEGEGRYPRRLLHQP